MIDLTPLDVRNKRGDFKKLMRGYDPQEVDVFLEIAAERLEALVRENLQLKDRSQTLQQQVSAQLGREQAVQDALVTAQELRADIKAQSQREAEHLLKEAQTEARRVIAEAEAQVRGRLRGLERQIDGANDSLANLERRRERFIRDFRQLLERQLESLEVEEARAPEEDRSSDFDMSMGAPAAVAATYPTGQEADAPVAFDEPTTAEHGTESDTGPTATPAEPQPTHEPDATSDARSAYDDEADESWTEAVESVHERAEEHAGQLDRTSEPDPVREGDASLVPSMEAAPAHAEPTADAGPASDLDRTDERSIPADLLPPPLPASLTRSKTSDPLTPVIGHQEGHQRELGELSESMAAEAVAEAGSQVVEVKGLVGEIRDVPRLEELLAEAGADFVDPMRDGMSQAPRSTEEIEPPQMTDAEESTLLYLQSRKRRV